MVFQGFPWVLAGFRPVFEAFPTDFGAFRGVSRSLQGFHAKFEHDEQPLLILFDVWDADSPRPGRVEDTGEHLGTVAVPLLDCLPPASRKHRLTLRGATQLHEGRLNKSGQSRVQPEELKVELKDVEEEERLPKQSCLDRQL